MKPEPFDAEFAYVCEFFEAEAVAEKPSGSKIPDIVTSWAEKAGIKVPEALRRYKTAGEIVGEQYPKVEKESDQWYRLKVGIFQGMMGFKKPEAKPAPAPAGGAATKGRPDSRDAATKKGKDDKNKGRVRVSVSVDGHKSESVADLFVGEAQKGKALSYEVALAQSKKVGAARAEGYALLAMTVASIALGNPGLNAQLVYDGAVKKGWMKPELWAHYQKLGPVGVGDLMFEERKQMSPLVFQVIDLLSQTEGFVEAVQIQEALEQPRLAPVMTVLTALVAEGVFRYEKGRGYGLAVTVEEAAVRAGPVAEAVVDRLSKLGVTEAASPEDKQLGTSLAKRLDKYIRWMRDMGRPGQKDKDDAETAPLFADWAAQAVKLQAVLRRGDRKAVGDYILNKMESDAFSGLASWDDDEESSRAEDVLDAIRAFADGTDESLAESPNYDRVVDFILSKNPTAEELRREFRLALSSAEWLLRTARESDNDRTLLTRAAKRVMESVDESKLDLALLKQIYGLALKADAPTAADAKQLTALLARGRKSMGDLVDLALAAGEYGADWGETKDEIRQAWKEQDESVDEAGSYSIQYRIPGRGWAEKSFPNQAAAEKWVERLIQREGDDVEVNWPRRESVEEVSLSGGVTVEPYPTHGSKESMWLVKKGGAALGYVTKYKNSRTETHPHKAFRYAVPVKDGDSAPESGTAYLGATFDGGLKTAASAVANNTKLSDTAESVDEALLGSDPKNRAAVAKALKTLGGEGTLAQVVSVLKRDRLLPAKYQSSGFEFDVAMSALKDLVSSDRVHQDGLNAREATFQLIESESLLPDTIDAYERVNEEGGLSTGAMTTVFGTSPFPGYPEMGGGVVDPNGVPWFPKGDGYGVWERWLPDVADIEEIEIDLPSSHKLLTIHGDPIPAGRYRRDELPGTPGMNRLKSANNRSGFLVRPDELDAQLGTSESKKKTSGKGVWRTTKSGHRIYIENGKITKGNPHVISRQDGSFEPKPGQWARDRKPKGFGSGVAGRKSESIDESFHKGYWYVGGKLHDVSSDFGGGTNDHVGFLWLSDEGQSHGREFGLTPGDIQVLRDFYESGDADADVGAVFTKVRESGAVRLRVFDQTLAVTMPWTAVGLRSAQTAVLKAKIAGKQVSEVIAEANDESQFTHTTYEGFLSATRPARWLRESTDAARSNEPDDALKAELRKGATSFHKRGQERSQARIENVKLKPVGDSANPPSFSDPKNPETKGRKGDEYAVSYEGKAIGTIRFDGSVWSSADATGKKISSHEGWSLRNAISQLLSGTMGDAWGHSAESVDEESKRNQKKRAAFLTDRFYKQEVTFRGKLVTVAEMIGSLREDGMSDAEIDKEVETALLARHESRSVEEVLSLSVKLARVARTLREHGQETLADDLVRAAKAGDRSDVRTVADSVERLARELSLPRLKSVANAIKDELEDTLGEAKEGQRFYAFWRGEQLLTQVLASSEKEAVAKMRKELPILYPSDDGAGHYLRTGRYEIRTYEIGAKRESVDERVKADFAGLGKGWWYIGGELFLLPKDANQHVEWFYNTTEGKKAARSLNLSVSDLKASRPGEDQPRSDAGMEAAVRIDKALHQSGAIRLRIDKSLGGVYVQGPWTDRGLADGQAAVLAAKITAKDAKGGGLRFSSWDDKNAIDTDYEQFMAARGLRSFGSKQARFRASLAFGGDESQEGQLGEGKARSTREITTKDGTWKVTLLLKGATVESIGGQLLTPWGKVFTIKRLDAPPWFTYEGQEDFALIPDKVDRAVEDLMQKAPKILGLGEAVAYGDLNWNVLYRAREDFVFDAGRGLGKFNVKKGTRAEIVAGNSVKLSIAIGGSASRVGGHGVEMSVEEFRRRFEPVGKPTESTIDDADAKRVESVHWVLQDLLKHGPYDGRSRVRSLTRNAGVSTSTAERLLAAADRVYPKGAQVGPGYSETLTAEITKILASVDESESEAVSKFNYTDEPFARTLGKRCKSCYWGEGSGGPTLTCGLFDFEAAAEGSCDAFMRSGASWSPKRSDRAKYKREVLARGADESVEEADEFAGLKRRHGSGPVLLNASINRQLAGDMFNAGMTVEQIAAAFGKVFFVSDGKLGQKYDSYYPVSGRKETKYTINRSAVEKVIARHKKNKPAEEAQVDEVDLVAIGGLLGSVVAGGALGSAVIAVLRSIQAALRTGKTSAAEAAWTKLPKKDRDAVQALLRQRVTEGVYDLPDAFLAACGMNPDGTVIPREPEKLECLACRKHDAYWHEAHADTGMDEFVVRCRACGADTSADEYLAAHPREETVDEADLAGATKYIRAIANEDKQAYAEAWLRYCQGKDDNPDESALDISYMAAQAVRQRLAVFGFEPTNEALVDEAQPSGDQLRKAKTIAQSTVVKTDRYVVVDGTVWYVGSNHVVNAGPEEEFREKVQSGQVRAKLIEADNDREDDEQFASGGAGGGPPLNGPPLRRKDRPVQQGRTGAIRDTHATSSVVEAQTITIQAVDMPRFLEVARQLGLPESTDIDRQGQTYVVHLDRQTAAKVAEAMQPQTTG